MPVIIIAMLILGLVAGCSSSEESGLARRSGQPAPEPRRMSLPADTMALSGRPASGAQARQAARPSVKRGQDTVRASTSRTVRTPVQKTPLVKPPDAMYTVQVGAFRQASNALRLHQTMKAAYAERPVFNMFGDKEKLYRVTVGKFETLQEASRFRLVLMKDHPEISKECWVTYIERSRR